MGLNTFRKEERIRRPADFGRVSKEGEQRQTPHFRVSTCSNLLPYRRLGIKVGRGVGSAVQRNRLKRLLREFFRRNKGEWPSGLDFVIAVKKGAAGLDYCQVSGELKGIFREL
jgi:ribonuclease P protein component